MDWSLKIQGRFATEAQVNEIRMLLCDHPSWNRAYLFQELCGRWNWQRPDGQIKDMACRELLRKLESRTLITLPPRQRRPVDSRVIDPIDVNQSSVSCLLSDIKPVNIVNARECSEHEKVFNYLVKEYYYLSYTGTCYKAANWIKVGQTKGRSRQDRDRAFKVSIKDVFVYPLGLDYSQLRLA